eukprot:10259275-Alexandrium_andersonii.AAC.1
MQHSSSLRSNIRRKRCLVLAKLLQQEDLRLGEAARGDDEDGVIVAQAYGADVRVAGEALVARALQVPNPGAKLLGAGFAATATLADSE